MVISFDSHSVTLFALFSVLWSQGSGFPAVDSDPSSRTRRDSDGLLTSEFGEMLDQLSASEFLEALISNSTRAKRPADGPFTSEESKKLDQLSALELIESLVGNSPSAQDDDGPSKRHTDSIFTDNYSRVLKKIALKKYIARLLNYRKIEAANLANIQPLDEESDNLADTEPLGEE